VDLDRLKTSVKSVSYALFFFWFLFWFLFESKTWTFQSLIRYLKLIVEKYIKTKKYYFNCKNSWVYVNMYDGFYSKSKWMIRMSFVFLTIILLFIKISDCLSFKFDEVFIIHLILNNPSIEAEWKSTKVGSSSWLDPFHWWKKRKTWPYYWLAD